MSSLSKSILLFFVIINFSFSQNKQEKTTIVKGNYTDGSQGIFILNESEFVLYGYSTLVFGEYTLKGDKVNFIPRIPSTPFVILARENKSIKKGIKINFNETFRNELTLIKFDNDNLKYVYDVKRDYNNFKDHIKYIDFLPNTISLTQISENNLYPNNTFIFELINKKFNDIIIFYTPIISENEPFNETYIFDKKTPLFITQFGELILNKEVDEDLEQLISKVMRELKNVKNSEKIYYNSYLKKVNGYNHLSEDASIFDIKNYIFDNASNKYINHKIYIKNKNYINEDVKNYHDESIILEYQKINVKKTVKLNLDVIKTIKLESLF